MAGRSVRVLHISDLHMRSADGPQAARARLEAASRWRVLGAKWTANLAEIRRDGTPVDLVVFTGDLGDWGHPTDYPRALAFLKQTCAALDVPLDRLLPETGTGLISEGRLTSAVDRGDGGTRTGRCVATCTRRSTRTVPAARHRDDQVH